MQLFCEQGFIRFIIGSFVAEREKKDGIKTTEPTAIRRLTDRAERTDQRTAYTGIADAKRYE